jgi:hypothetical protein
MRISFLLLFLIIFMACKKNETSSGNTNYNNDSCTIQCIEQAVEPEFRNYADSMLDTVVYKLYAANGKFDSFIKEVTYFDKATVESHFSLSSKYDYEVIVAGVDTFRIWRFVNTPRSEKMWCGGPHGNYGLHCYYYEDMIMVDKDTVRPYGGEYVSKIILYKK